MRINTVRLKKVLDLQMIVYLLAILMEVLIAYIWFVWIIGISDLALARAPLSIISTALLAVTTSVLTRLSYSRNWSLARARLLVLSISIFLMAVLITLDNYGGYYDSDTGFIGYIQMHALLFVYGFSFGSFVIWRSIVVAQKINSFESLNRKFLLGLTAMVVLLVLWAITSMRQGTHIHETLSLYVASYFSLGLLALALQNLAALRTKLLLHQEGIASFNRHSLLIIMGLVLFILGISILIASAVSINLTGTLVKALNVFSDWLLISLLWIIFLPIGLIIGGLTYVIKLFLKTTKLEKPPQQFTLPDLSDLYKAAEEQSTRQIPAIVILVVKWALLITIIILVIVFLARTFVRHWKQTREDVEEINESIWSFSLFKSDLLAFLSWLFNWSRRQKPLPLQTSLPPISVQPEKNQPDRLFNIIEIYHGLLWQGNRIGIPRKEPETPYEYQKRFSTRSASLTHELSAITEAYVVHYYGDSSLNNEQLVSLNHSWHSVLSVLEGALSD